MKARFGRQQRALAKQCEDNRLPRLQKYKKAYGIGGQPRALKANSSAGRPKPKAPSRTAKPAQKPAFVPAGSIEEAQEYAKRFISESGFSPTFKNTALFEGMSLDMANEMNETLEELYSRFDMPKLSGVKVISPTSSQGRKMFSDSDAVMAYSPVEHGIFINKNVLKDRAALDGYNSKATKPWYYVMQSIANLTGRQRELATVYKDAGRSLVGNRSVHDYVVHEMGHHAEWTMLDASEHNAIGKSMSTYAPHISGYANVSVSEYMAESFSAYVGGEISVIDPSFVSIMERKGMISGSSTATSAAVEYGRLGISSLPEIWLPTGEHAEVMS